MNKFAKILSNLFQKKVKNTQNFDFSTFKSCLIVTNEEVPNEFLKNVPNPQLLFYSEMKSIPKGNYFRVDEKDINWMGKVKNERLAEILANNYDLFINYNSENSSILDIINTRNNSKLKVGNAGTDWAHIEITTNNNDREEFYKQLYTIIQKINKKKE